MLLIVNSTPYATITATLLTPAQHHTADQSDLSILVTCKLLAHNTAAVYSVQETCTRKKLVQETATDVQLSCAS